MPSLRQPLRILEPALAWVLGRRIFAVAGLTLKATFRYRLIQVMLLLLAAAVIGLPAVIKHDGTAGGFTQILLTYTLGSITILLGFATLWLGCGTLSRDIEECQMQLVVVKPIQRWEVWLGKWLGILTLNALLLGLSGVTIYTLLQARASRLPPEIQQELRQTILVARGSIRPPVPQTMIDAEIERRLRARLQDPAVAQMPRAFVRDQITERVKAESQLVGPGTIRRWEFDFGARAAALRHQPLSIRTQFYAASRVYLPSDTTYGGWWEIGPPDGVRYRPDVMSLAAETIHEFNVPPGYLDPQGKLLVDFYNFNDTALLFPLEDGIEVLYPEGSFVLNLARALGIIFCWLALLAAIGLTAGSFLSFPVAAFCAVGILLVSASTGTLRQIIEERGVTGVDSRTGMVESPGIFNRTSIVLARGLLSTINVVRDFSPVDALSAGRSVTWGQLTRAFAQIVLFMGGVFGAIGILLFTRRELAATQGA
jgi:hypothetical protein